MKFKLLFVAIFASSIFISCSPGDVPAATYLWEGQAGPFGGVGVCCKVPGTTCYNKGTSFIPPVLRTYIDNDNLRGYFLNENWQAQFPELINHQDKINLIIQNNLKALIMEDRALAVLIDRTKAPLTNNVLVGFKLRESPECDKFFQN